jgi:hypothetical protein
VGDGDGATEEAMVEADETGFDSGMGWASNDAVGGFETPLSTAIPSCTSAAPLPFFFFLFFPLFPDGRSAEVAAADWDVEREEECWGMSSGASVLPIALSFCRTFLRIGRARAVDGDSGRIRISLRSCSA